MSRRVAAVVLIAVTLAALHPLLLADFTSWDDLHNVTANPHVAPPSIEGLRFHWTHSWRELYVPITYTAWIALSVLSGASPNATLFHGANLVAHMFAALLAFRVLTKLGFATAAACAGALVFAVHPVQVESVGWVSGLKDVLAGVFCLIAIERHIEFVREGGKARHVMTLGAFILAALAKPSAVTLPLVIFAIDVLMLRRPARLALRSIVPMLLLAVPVAIVGVIAQPPSILQPIPLWWRPLVAGHALALYLWKLVWPVNLAIDYGQSPWTVMRTTAGFVAWIVPGLVTIACVLAYRRGVRAPLAALAVFVAALLPVLGLQPFEFQAKSTTADHYLYLPMFGVAIAVAAAARALGRRAWIGVAVAVALLAARSWDQSRYWHDNESLYRRAIAVNPRSTAALQNLIVVAMDRSDTRTMERLARQMIEADPSGGDGAMYLGMALAFQNRFAEAHAVLDDVVRRHPRHVAARIALAAVLIDLSRPADALAEYDRVAEIDPKTPNLANLRARAARLAENASSTTRPATQP